MSIEFKLPELGERNRAIAEAARRNKVSEQSVSRWKAQFLEGGRAGVAEGGKAGPSGREEQL